MKRIIHYKRVSTTSQNSERQDKNIVMGAVPYEDKISGSVLFKERPLVKATLIDEVESGEVSELHVHSIDRLGRNTIDIMQTIEWLTDNDVNVISQKEGLRTLNDDGSINPMSKLLVGILGTLAEFELSRIKERQAEGIANAQEKGVYIGGVGRKKGEVESATEFLNKAKNRYIQKQLNNGESIRGALAKTKFKFGKCSISTVQKVRKMLAEVGA